MLDVHFVILGVVGGGVGQVLYVRDTITGRTRPNRVTWLLWAVAPLLAFAVEIRSGVGLRALMTFMVGFGPLAVLGASFLNRASVWHVTRLDLVCGGLSVMGTVAWLITEQGLVALSASILADLLAAIPTVVKSWRRPGSESANVYGGALFSAVVTLLTVRHVSAAMVAFPLYIALLAATMIGIILVRHRQVSNSPSDPGGCPPNPAQAAGR
ncbi:MAG: hypothetical protein ACYCS7_06265 [Acidimicrobiales bacterium]